MWIFAKPGQRSSPDELLRESGLYLSPSRLFDGRLARTKTGLWIHKCSATSGKGKPSARDDLYSATRRSWIRKNRILAACLRRPIAKVIDGKHRDR